MALRWTPEAIQDRETIYDDIEADNPIAALALDERFEEKAGRLIDHPALGRPGRVAGTRELVAHQNFILIYAVTDMWCAYCASCTQPDNGHDQNATYSSSCLISSSPWAPAFHGSRHHRPERAGQNRTVHRSLVHREFGIAVAEALAVGTPVLISDNVNIWREIDADGAGLVAPDTRDGTASLLQRWLALAPDARQQMAEQARHCFAQRFEMRRAVENLLGVVSATVGRV